MSFVILDLDNCISDDGWRIERINWQKKNPFDRYHEYHLLAGFDRAANKDLFQNSEHEIIVLTARPAHYSAITLEWLSRNEIDAYALVMRNNDDHSPSWQLKEKQVQWLEDYYSVHRDEIALAFDDRPEIVEMYNRLGIKAEVRSIHNQNAYKAPTKE